MNITKPVIAIVGPTASGKTALSVDLAARLNGEIINGDSMQVYKGLDIGTAKITKEEMGGIPHHLFDIKNPSEEYSVADYQADVRGCIEEISSRGKQPIIVGGTGLYIQAVLFDFRFTEQAGDPNVRYNLEIEASEQGSHALYDKLRQLDPESAEKIHPNNTRRIIRALEIIEVTGKSKMDHEQGKGDRALYPHLLIGLDLPRDLLYERINWRVDDMVDRGLVTEVRTLWDQGVRGTQAVQAIGYKELYRYLEGSISLEEAVELVKKNTRNYAKRQLTYLRNKLEISWFDATEDRSELIEGILTLLKDYPIREANSKQEK
ncbi:tRNA (adenosine(37)-N6)-dimethylallyltransferase MiaA [Sporosarcina sp. Te-1]|uniref:tRNA (adenosine(37)-N6)-dimethylallyltransferase MiaA n=1 Tax=Sporosarcina sp. Te-1 TaxID=2818390 RepID=UPI001A9DB1D7|nr:tRNA (adenosine(37)-N6)-dimethylallyltransferase MiaA [Sporosarcina sp. Te-1]QTD42251.1 tRNA (adenosine(37)-N6)-dimethylallyltransferase MiaA [Sporosarcina sp. Te-1]